MNFSHKNLVREVRSLVAERLNVPFGQEQKLRAAWIVPIMLDRHPAPVDWRGEDYDAWHHCYCAHIKDIAREAVREIKGEEEKGASETRQLLFPGFKRLQRCYQIEQDGEPTIVPLPEMSDAEIEAKAEELSALGRGNIEHSDELRRYLADRMARRAA